MGGRRTTPPLFELLRDADAQIEKSERAGAVQGPDAPPRDEGPPPPRTPPDAPRPETPGDDRDPWLLDGTKKVSISLNVVLIGAAAMILVVVVVISVAWQMGLKGGQAESRQLLDKLSPSAEVVDPLVDDMPVNSDLIGTDSPSEGTQAAPPQRPARTGRYIVSGGRLAADPREPGHNYLWIASHTAKIDESEARRVVDYLGRAGLDALAAPVDPDRVGSNNARYYNVFVLQGIPSGQFRQRRQEQEDLERRVAELGRSWLRENAGTTDFRDPLWKKFNP